MVAVAVVALALGKELGIVVRRMVVVQIAELQMQLVRMFHTMKLVHQMEEKKVAFRSEELLEIEHRCMGVRRQDVHCRGELKCQLLLLVDTKQLLLLLVDTKGQLQAPVVDSKKQLPMLIERSCAGC